MAAEKHKAKRRVHQELDYVVAPGRSIVAGGVVLCGGERVNQTKVNVDALVKSGAIVAA